MNIHFQSIEVHSSFLTKAFRIHGIIEYYREIEAPFQISGVVKTDDGIIISILQEVEIQQPTDMHLVLHRKDIEDKIYGSANSYKNQHAIQLIAPVPQESIQHIESVRQSDRDQSVRLHINYAIKYLVAQHQQHNLVD